MDNKNKALIVIASDLYTRNFLLSGALDRIKTHYDIQCVVTQDCDASKCLGYIKESAIHTIQYSDQRNKRFYYFAELDMVRLRHKCSTFDIKYRLQLPKVRKVLWRILSLPGIYQLYKAIFMNVMGEHDGIVNLIEEQKPDLVFIPTSLVEGVAADIVNTCQRRNIKTFMLINGWDNISSKGTIPNMPDFIGVWGKQSKHHACELHPIAPERVFNLGVPHFKQYYQAPEQNKEEFRRSLGLPTDKKIILFAGSCRVFDETSILLELEQAIESKKFKDIHVLYRPHPWRHLRQHEDSYFDHTFKHVTIDPDLAESYKRHKTDTHYVNLPETVLPDLSRYVNLYNAIDGVICPLTTIIVEAAITGVPVLAIAFNDHKHRLTMDKIIENKHFEGIDDIPGIIVCRDHGQFMSDCQKLFDVTQQSEVRSNLKAAVNYIAHHDENDYSTRLFNAVQYATGISPEVLDEKKIKQTQGVATGV